MPTTSMSSAGRPRYALAVLTAALLSIGSSSTSSAQWKYPATKTVDASDTYFGKTYSDPYRWLENLKDKEVEAWFTDQAALTESVLKKIPGRQTLVDEWTALDKLKPASYGRVIYENGRNLLQEDHGRRERGEALFPGWP